MKYGSYSTIALAIMLMVGPPTIAGAQKADTTAKKADTTANIDPDAIEALNKMGAYLRTLKEIEVRAQVTKEDVLIDGQKVQTISTSTLVAKKPDKLRLSVTNEHQERVFLYDGTSFTLFAPRPNFYATVPAPATISELANLLEDKYDIDLPFVDLFRWGTPESNLDDIDDAKDIGPSVIDGTTCEHYAFRQDGLDWEVWIQQGDYPLPRRLVLTTTTDDARPQHTSEYAWNLAPSVSPDTYKFTPPADAKKIPLAEARATATATKKEDKRK